MKTQFGRSMIEMLGVLAIVGVLVIGGVWGYRKAVTKYLANSVIDDINLSGFLVMDELFSSLPNDDVGLDLTGRFDQKSPYTFKAFAETGTSFEILVSGVPYPVCQELKEREFKDIDEVRANGLVDECLSSGDNDISFFFDTDPTAGTPCETDEDCPTACGKCNSKNRCRNECEVIPDSCTTNDDCANSGVCAGCVVPDGQDTGTCQYACEPVQYIENQDLDSYLILPIAMNKSIKYKVDLKIEDTTGTSVWKFILGSRTDTSNDSYLGVTIVGQIGRFFAIGKYINDNIGIGGSGIYKQTNTTNIMRRHTLEFTGNALLVDGSSAENSYRDEVVRTYSNIPTTGVFGLANSATSMSSGERRMKFKLYRLQIRNDTTRMDLVPVLDPDGEPAMLDKINQKLYYNMGSGTFVTDKD